MKNVSPLSSRLILLALLMAASAAAPASAQHQARHQAQHQAQNQAEPAPQRCTGPLPPPVAARHQAILAAARAGDYAALRREVSEPQRFQSGYGEQGDPTPAWREAQRQKVDLPASMAAIFAMTCSVSQAEGRTLYTWPSANDFAWSALTAAEQQALQRFYGAKLDNFWLEGRAKGYYVGWRGVIDARGSWLAFVAGD